MQTAIITTYHDSIIVSCSMLHMDGPAPSFYTKHMVVILHNIRSMHNVGSVFRIADAVGVEKIYLCGFTPAPINEFGQVRQQLGKVSLGAELVVSWEKRKNIFAVLDELKKCGFQIFAVEQNKFSMPYYQVKLAAASRKRTALVLGHEVKGLTPAILKRADKILEIPMAGKKESLNVAVAFGIVVFSLIYK